MPRRIVTNHIARAMQTDRDAGMLLAEIADRHGWSEWTVSRHTTPSRPKQAPDLTRYRRILSANASPEADRDAIAGRFGLANRNVLSVTVWKAKRILAEHRTHPPVGAGSGS